MWKDLLTKASGKTLDDVAKFILADREYKRLSELSEYQEGKDRVIINAQEYEAWFNPKETKPYTTPTAPSLKDVPKTGKTIDLNFGTKGNLREVSKTLVMGIKRGTQTKERAVEALKQYFGGNEEQATKYLNDLLGEVAKAKAPKFGSRKIDVLSYVKFGEYTEEQHFWNSHLGRVREGQQQIDMMMQSALRNNPKDVILKNLAEGIENAFTAFYNNNKKYRAQRRKAQLDSKGEETSREEPKIQPEMESIMAVPEGNMLLLESIDDSFKSLRKDMSDVEKYEVFSKILSDTPELKFHFLSLLIKGNVDELLQYSFDGKIVDGKIVSGSLVKTPGKINPNSRLYSKYLKGIKSLLRKIDGYDDEVLDLVKYAREALGIKRKIPGVNLTRLTSSAKSKLASIRRERVKEVRSKQKEQSRVRIAFGNRLNSFKEVIEDNSGAIPYSKKMKGRYAAFENDLKELLKEILDDKFEEMSLEERRAVIQRNIEEAKRGTVSIPYNRRVRMKVDAVGTQPLTQAIVDKKYNERYMKLMDRLDSMKDDLILDRENRLTQLMKNFTNFMEELEYLESIMGMLSSEDIQSKLKEIQEFTNERQDVLEEQMELAKTILDDYIDDMDEEILKEKDAIDGVFEELIRNEIEPTDLDNKDIKASYEDALELKKYLTYYGKLMTQLDRIIEETEGGEEE